jgi:hypothetical protein
MATLLQKFLYGIAPGLLVAGLAVGGTLEAKKDDVEVYTAADKGSAVITKLKKGAEITSGERSGMYWQVKLPDGKAGYVSVMVVKIKADSGSGLNDALRDAVKAGRETAEQSGARSRSAVMGVRGLDDNNTAMAGSVRPNLRAVYGMEDMELPKTKLDQQASIIENDIMARMKN